MTTPSGGKERVFSFRVIRGIVGGIALSIAAITAWVSRDDLRSISASYHTDARDLYIGVLFVVAAIMAAYNGKPGTLKIRPYEKAVAKIAAISMLLVALFPTGIKECEERPECFPNYANDYAGIIGVTPPDIHGVMAVAMFVMLFFFMVVFAIRAWPKEGGRCRAVVYMICGAGMVCSLVFVAVNRDYSEWNYGGVFWTEFFALIFFGLGWLYSGAYKWLEAKAWWPKCPYPRDGAGTRSSAR